MLRISRHARNGMRLYDISLSDITNAVDAPDIMETESDRIVAIKRFANRFSGYSLKVVYRKIER